MKEILTIVKSAKYGGSTVDLDDVFELSGYTTKGNAVRQLEKVCDEEEDYTIITTEPSQENPTPIKKYLLTYRGFQCFLASAQTDVGKAFRKHIFDYIDRLEQENLRLAQENAKLLEDKIFWMNCSMEGKEEHIRELESLRRSYEPIVNKYYDQERAKWERKQKKMRGY